MVVDASVFLFAIPENSRSEVVCSTASIRYFNIPAFSSYGFSKTFFKPFPCPKNIDKAMIK
jgi:hypothetical protein